MSNRDNLAAETKPTHTPGPWLIDDDSGPDELSVCDESGRYEIASSVGGPVRQDSEGGYNDYREVEANARLIAAAPDLLAALEKALHDSGCDGDLCNWAWHEAARTAIAKATGAE